MCFLMGTSAGGMLPIVYALMAETVPARMRGWVVILHGGLGTACGYLAASGLAALFEPAYTWRILWFFGLPTGLLIVALNRWIPESPRFLLQRGHEAEARAVMQQFGIAVEARPASLAGAAADAGPARTPAGFAALFRAGLARHSTAVMLYGLGWGIVNWGFITFLPTILRDAGLQANSNALLFYGALASIPGTVAVAFLYGRWSSRGTMIGFALLTSVSLVAFAVMGSTLAQISTWLLVALIAVLMLSSTGVIAMLSPYAAEVYPTTLRGTGSGLAAASSKLGGVIGPPVVGALLTAAGSIVLPALVAAVPMGIAAVALMFIGEETRERSLENISERV
jgi:putative MFS transporter